LRDFTGVRQFPQELHFDSDFEIFSNRAFHHDGWVAAMKPVGQFQRRAR
jgi:hypothetical protein